MTQQTGSAVPGRALLRLVRFVFDDDTVDRLFEPAVADLQREVNAGGLGPARRAWVLVREHAAVWKLLAVAMTMPGAGAGAPLTAVLLGRHSAGSLLLLVPVLFLAMSWMFGAFVAGAVVAGAMLSFVLGWWNRHHPAAVACTRRGPAARDPEINLSSIPVGGDIGGFCFVAASSAVVLLGVPGLRAFVAAAVVAGMLLAWARVAWMRAHEDPPANHVVGR